MNKNKITENDIDREKAILKESGNTWDYFENNVPLFFLVGVVMILIIGALNYLGVFQV